MSTPASRALGNLLGSSNKVNPISKLGAPRTQALAMGRDTRHRWVLIGQKFGLGKDIAERTRKVLQNYHGAEVKKVLANIHTNHWQFFKKVSLR